MHLIQRTCKYPNPFNDWHRREALWRLEFQLHKVANCSSQAKQVFKQSKSSPCLCELQHQLYAMLLLMHIANIFSWCLHGVLATSFQWAFWTSDHWALPHLTQLLSPWDCARFTCFLRFFQWNYNLYMIMIFPPNYSPRCIFLVLILTVGHQM